MSRPLRAVLAEAVARLAAAGVAGAARDARLLLAEATGIAPSRLSLEPDRQVDETAAFRLEKMLAARAAGRPVSRILGRRDFWGRGFELSDAVLDPRPETETLVAAALARPAPAHLLDLGTGSGILAITLLAEWPRARALATDIDPDCLAVAEKNAARHRVADRLITARSDWFDKVAGSFGLIVSNPPYIAAREMPGLAREARDHDPEHALTPGGDGLGAYREIAAGAPARLAAGGWLMVEIGPGQAAAVCAMFRAAGLADIAVLPDLDGRDRVVQGRKPAEMM